MDFPISLYKFRGFTEYSLRLLTDSEVYFAAPKDLNDPLDCAVPIAYEAGTRDQIYRMNLQNLGEICPGIPMEELKEFAGQQADVMFSNRNDPERQELFRKGIVDETNAMFGILSLSASRHDTRMWAYYAQAHSGFCVGFDVERLLEFCCDEFRRGVGIRLRRVDYYEPLPVISPYEIDEEQMFMTLVSSKTRDWEHEQEYRLISTKPNYILQLPVGAIESITLGISCSTEHEDQVKAILRHRGDNLQLYRAKQLVEPARIEFDDVVY